MAAFILAPALLVGAYLLKGRGDVTYQQADDGNSYYVLNRPDARAAANMLARVRGKLEALVADVQTEYPDNADARRLAAKFNPANISEGSPHSGYTSFTVDKGAKVVLCIRQKEDERLVPEDVVVYVAVHELAHIMTNEIGHTDVFWANNRILVDRAETLGLYKAIHFETTPQPYCGLTIDKTL